MGIDETGRGPVSDSKTLKEEKSEKLFEELKVNESIGWAMDVTYHRELSAKLLNKNKINLNEISHDSAIGLITRVLSMGVLLTEVYLDTVGDAEKYRVKLSERFPSIKFVTAKKADSLYPVVSSASIVAKVTSDRALRGWILEEAAENMHGNFGSGYPGGHDRYVAQVVFQVLFLPPSNPRVAKDVWSMRKQSFMETLYNCNRNPVLKESNKMDDDRCSSSRGKQQLKLSNAGLTSSKKRSKEIESSGKGRS